MFKASTRFLVVDDFSTMRKIIKKVLGELGYTNIVEAVDGQNALEVIKSQAERREPIDFIISDWNMPKMLGIDLLKHCKQSTDLKSVPFILVTAESEQAQIVEAVKAGVSEYVVKPFSAQVIKEKIERVYAKHNPASKAA